MLNLFKKGQFFFWFFNDWRIEFVERLIGWLQNVAIIKNFTEITGFMFIPMKTSQFLKTDRVNPP